MEAPSEDGWIQDEDVLDTWFSSALWPFSTMGWPEKTEMMERYYPNNVLVTAYDIIFFWVSKMVFQGLEFTGERPFKDCLIHGLIRDKNGTKMSKSLGNVVDPIDMIEEYGADALRFYLTTTAAAGTDLKFDEEKVKSTWNFINKLWNASRYVLINTEDYNYTLDNLTLADKWILTKLNKTIKDVTKNMEKYDFNIVGDILHSFIWNDFCSWYIELSKINLNDTSKSVLVYTLKNILKMLHPFMPFVTEEIYTRITDEKTIMKSKYPEYNENQVFKEAKNMDSIIELITKIRRIKLENSAKDIYLEYDNKILEENKDILDKLTKAEYTNNYNGLDKITISFGDTQVNLYYDGRMNKTLELESLYKEKERLQNSIQRREKLLSNTNYINKAPKKIVDEEMNNLQKEKQELENILIKIQQ